MKVTRLPVETGVSGWEAILPQPKMVAPLDAATNADYLVIGGGFTGLAAARRLSQIEENKRIVLLDAKRIGEGPAGRNSGFMIDLPHEIASADYASFLECDRKQIALNRRAISFGRDAVSEYELPAEAFDESGKINGAVAVKAVQHNLDYARHLDSLGEGYELLSASQMQKTTGTSLYQSGLFTAGTVLLQPVMYCRGLASGLANQVSVFENSPVTSLVKNNGKWIAETPMGSVSATKIILATNGHIESFGFFKRQVFHVILYGSMTRALSDEESNLSGRSNWGITPSDPAATTMRKFQGTGGTRIITRNQMTYSPGLQSSDALLAKMTKRHETSFVRRYPQLAQVEQEYSWAGRLCLSRNASPAFGEVAGGLFAACCQNGLGTTRGTLAGMAAAEFAVEGQTELVQALLEQGTPTRLPPSPLDTIGASALMRWSEFKARSEL